MLDIKGLHFRAALFRCIREFFAERGFLEVDTPIRLPDIIPESNIEAIMADGQYLQTSPELCMKRLLASGCSKIFQICHCFRKNEIGKKHLEEFTMLEWYRIDADYNDLMKDCTELFEYVLQSSLFSGDSLDQSEMREFYGKECLRYPPKTLTVKEAFAMYAPVSLSDALRDDVFDEILVEHVEPNLGKECPVFLKDYPCQMASLARVSYNNPQVAERFELYACGLELANGFSELTDSDEQRTRFVQEVESIFTHHGRTQRLPDKFLQDLERIESAAGIALGVDRFLMLLTGKRCIDDVVTFSPYDM